MKYLRKFKIFEARCECGFEWSIKEDDKDKYTCRKCGKDNEKLEWMNEFEILSFKYKFFEEDSIDKSRTIKKGDPEFEDCIYDCVSSAYNKDLVEIYSVKRLSDNEIFTLGDDVFLEDKYYATITKIWPSFHQMRADSGNLGLVLNKDFFKSKQKGK